jgi:uncharacterized protein
MFFLMQCPHHPNCDATKDQLRPAHRQWVQTGGDGLASVLIGSALWDSAGQATGNFGILEAASESAARAFAEGDPFFKAGVIAEIRLTRLADSFQAHRIERMTQAAAQ